MNYKIDTHIHSEYSYDGIMPLSVIIEQARKHGINAVAVCDHGRVLKNVPEYDRVTVIPGAEFSTEYGHLIGLFLTDDIEKGDFKALCENIHSQGGIAVLAHPFQRGKYKDKLSEAAKYIDGVEVFNSRADRKNKTANISAYEFAKKHGLKFFAGSDAHTPEEIGNAYFTVECEGDLKDALMSTPVTVFGKRSPSVCVAKSQRAKLRKTKKGNSFKWFLFLIKCTLEDIFSKKEKKYVTYSEDR